MTTTLLSLENDTKKEEGFILCVRLLQDLLRKEVVTKVKINEAGGVFQPFNKEKSVGKSSDQVISKAPTLVPTSATSLIVDAMTGGTGGGDNKREDKEKGNQRKQRSNNRVLF